MTDDSRSSGRLKLLGGLILIAVFGAGAAAGFAVGRSAAPSRRPLPPGGLGLAPPSLAELELTPEQQRKAREIGERYRDEIEAVRREVAPRIGAIRARMRKEMDAFLTPEQLARQERRDRERRDGAGPGGPPAPPAAAREACAGKTASDPCRVDTRHGALDGTCRALPTPDAPLACVPAGGPGAEPPPGRRMDPL